jgi:protein-S-isoprenylcysteine O-methyltransferase Ste14
LLPGLRILVWSLKANIYNKEYDDYSRQVDPVEIQKCHEASNHQFEIMMFIRALLSFIVLPGVAAGIAPPVIASFDPWRRAVWMPGLVVMLAGAFLLLWCVRDFYVSGKGTLAPWDPPRKIVTVGLYRYVRNPMYVGVLLLVLGWSLYLSSVMLAAYMFVLATGFHIRVVRYEEPWMAAQFGKEWETYRATVPRWLPGSKP